MSPQSVCPNRCKVTLVTFVEFFSRVSFQMSSHIACQNGCIVALVSFQWLFPVWVFKCFLKSSEWRDAMSHWLNLNNFSPEWVFFSNCPPKRVHSRIGCISMTLFQCEFQMFSQIIWVNICEVALVAYERFFSRVSFQMSSHIACQNRCIVALVAFQWLFPVWVFKCFLKSSEWTYASHVGCIWTIFLKIEFSNVFSNWLSEQMHSCICTTFLHCEFQMCSQIVWVNRSEVALVAFERLFSRVGFQMSSQTVWVHRCIVTMVAFARLFFRLSFQTPYQIVRVNRCIVALVAFERFFSRVKFQMSSPIASQNRCIVALLANRMSEQMGCLCKIFL